MKVDWTRGHTVDVLDQKDVPKVGQDWSPALLGQWGGGQAFIDNATHFIPIKEALNVALTQVHAIYKEVDRPVRILDAGCFTGAVSHWLNDNSEAPFDYHGVDVNPDAIEAAKKLKRIRGATFECSDVHDVEGEFDIALCLRVLIHVRDPRAMVQHLMELAPVAVLAVSMSNNGEQKIRRKEVQLSGKPDSRAVVYHRYFTHKSIEGCCKGFDMQQPSIKKKYQPVLVKRRADV